MIGVEAAVDHRADGHAGREEATTPDVAELAADGLDSLVGENSPRAATWTTGRNCCGETADGSIAYMIGLLANEHWTLDIHLIDKRGLSLSARNPYLNAIG
jgi:hypothetical protein